MGFFAQDDWRVTRKLTLNYGVRWDYYGNPNEINGQQGTLNSISQFNGINYVDNASIAKSSSWTSRDLNNSRPAIWFRLRSVWRWKDGYSRRLRHLL